VDRHRPENDSTGGRVKQKGLSKRATAICAHFSLTARWPSCARRRFAWVTKLLGRMSAKQAAIAIANKTARIAWAIMVHGGVYEAGHRAPQYRAEACAAAG
jgi:transposase